MNKRELFILGFTLSLVALSLVTTIFYPAMSAALNRPAKKPIPGHGAIKAIGIGIFGDQSCTTAVSSIDWGMLDPGSIINKTVYVRNQADAGVTLAMGIQNWNPTSSSDYLRVSWDYTGQNLAVGQVIAVTFTLSVAENAQQIRDFSFDTVIAAM